MTTLIVSLALCLQAPAPPPTPKIAQAQIQRRYDEWSKAYMSMDVDTLLSILTPDYVLINFQKENTTLTQYSAYLKLRKKSGYKDPVKTSTRIKALRIVGSEADVNAIETMVTDGPDPQTHLSAKCLHQHEYLDIWKYNGGTWQLSQTRTLKESTTYKRP